MVAGEHSVEAAAILVNELIAAGVTEAVVCPGSRSAPLALAFAAAQEKIRVHVRTDERSAAFLALGIAHYTHTYVPVIMTSGTAVANCYPAVIEAALSHIPLMVISANRPWAYQDTGANQTIDQHNIFGHYAPTQGMDMGYIHTIWREQEDGNPNPAELYIRSFMDRALRSTHKPGYRQGYAPPLAGPVHIDIPFDTPLVPENYEELEEITAIIKKTQTQKTEGKDLSTSEPHRTYYHSHDYGPLGEISIDKGRRTLAVIGTVSNPLWAENVLEELTDIPAIAEPTAPVPDFPVHPAAAGMFQVEIAKPEQIILVGRPTLHRSIQKLLGDPSISLIALTEDGTVPDIAGTVAHVASHVRVVGKHPQRWLDTCRHISSMGVEVIRTELKEGFTGLHVAAVIADSLRDGDALVIGASNAIRDLSYTGLPFSGVYSMSNRGVAGIDGTISTAIGTALAHASLHKNDTKAPRTIALMGDVTFFHDIGALNIGPEEPRPENLIIVVSNDSGGSIFEGLEPGKKELRPYFERFFATPPGGRIEEICQSFGIPYRRAESMTELEEILYTEEENGGNFLILEARVDRSRRRDMQQSIQRQLS